MNTKTQEIPRYSIRETARLCGLPESTLRYYETIGVIDTIDRDGSSGHRTYSEENINRIISVACLNSTGLSIEGMKEYLSNASKGVDAAINQIELLRSQGLRLAEEERRLKLRRQYLIKKIGYWEALQHNDTERAEKLAAEALGLAKNLKANIKTN